MSRQGESVEGAEEGDADSKQNRQARHDNRSPKLSHVPLVLEKCWHYEENDSGTPLLASVGRVASSYIANLLEKKNVSTDVL